MRVSLIVAVYKDVEALSLIIEALKKQTYKNFEVVIAEDGESMEMQNYIRSIEGLDVKHTTQEDQGIRKTRSLNNGIIASSGEYLIFIDGDCIPYTTFIAGHIQVAERGCILSGRRVNLGPKSSKKLRAKTISAFNLEKYFVLLYPLIALDCIERHSEDGFYVDPSSWLYKKFMANRNSTKSLLGCNYSCYREDMIAINGYDEAYGETSVGDDTDLEWRFQAHGCKIKSVKNVANMFHLYHSRGFREKINSEWAYELMRKNKKNNLYQCQLGIQQH